MKICPNCGFPNRDEVFFCEKCRENIDLNPYTYIDAKEFQHKLDKEATSALEKLEPIVSAVKWAVDSFARIHKAELLGEAVKVSVREFPQVYKIAVECAKTLSLRKMPDIYVVNRPTWNAYTVGSANEPIIVLHAPLIDHLSEKELKAIIGHEMGHIKCDHVPYLTLVFLLANLPELINPLLKVATLPILAALYKWSRACELSADRASLICTRDLEAVKTALVKLVVGSNYMFSKIDLDEFIKQQDELEKMLSKDILAKAALAFRTHPLTTQRIKELESYFTSPSYINVVNKALSKSPAGRMVIFFLNSIYQGGLPFRQGTWSVSKKFIGGPFSRAELTVKAEPIDDFWYERHVSVEFNKFKLIDDKSIKTSTGLEFSTRIEPFIKINEWNILRVHIDSFPFKWRLTAYIKLME